MTDKTPNDAQCRLIQASDGVYAVDAGAGTGKTFTVTRRYANLLDQETIEPDDILLITFTKNAAAEMKERVVANCEYSMAQLRDAPINTFHGWCHTFLRTHGVAAPEQLGIDDQLTGQTRLLENETIERQRFRTFLRGFIEDHPEHETFYRSVRDMEGLLSLIKQLAAKGIFPTADGWYRGGERHLDGDFTAFKTHFDEANTPNEGARGPTQSDLRDTLNGYDRDRTYPPGAPAKREIRGDSGSIQIDESWAKDAFEEDRSALKAFVHDVYFHYIEFALGRNYLNFPFLQLFAFVLLCEDDELRASIQYEHVMVDEFQDTSEIQFKLALLLAGGGNFCAVGDWKQSIYSFQYAAVENLRSFHSRLRTFANELNGDRVRVDLPVGSVETISLRTNYRSTQAILDQSTQSLVLPATNTDEIDVDLDEITTLTAHRDHEPTTIEAFHGDDGIEVVLDRIETIVGNESFAIEDDGTLVTPSYGDIAVLTRKRRFGRELQRRAQDCAIPVAYEGGVRLYETDQAILLLAWLRLLQDRESARGWAVVLEEAGYTLAEIDHILDKAAYPDQFVAFRDRLADRQTVGAIARAVMDRYGFADAYADALVGTVRSVFEETMGTISDVIRVLEQSIEAGDTREVSDTPGADAVTVQTIHAAKGLEYPIVIVADMDEHSFPSTGGGYGDVIRFESPIGLRQTKLYREDGAYPFVFDNWRYRILSACLGTDYAEERRLLYVAMTRAKDHLLFGAGDSPGAFFEGLDIDSERIEPDLSEKQATAPVHTSIDVEIPRDTVPISRSPHALMDDRIFETSEPGRGIEFGTAVHEFAERYANGDDVDSPSNQDERHVKTFIDSLSGDPCVELSAYLPVEVDGRNVTISGVIDLLHVTEDRADIIDFKTDLTRARESEYRKQVSVYYHAVDQYYTDHDVTVSLFYTHDGSRQPIDPLSMADLRAAVAASLTL